MASKTMSKSDGSTAFAKMFPEAVGNSDSKIVKKQETEKAKTPVKDSFASELPPAKKTAKAPVVTEDVEQVESKTKKIGGRPKKGNTVHKMIYLTPELDEALRHRAYVDRAYDMSGHVRKALEAYLKDDLDAIN